MKYILFAIILNTEIHTALGKKKNLLFNIVCHVCLHPGGTESI